MPLSILKLQDMLISKGFIPNKYFFMDGCVFLIELFSIKTAEIFYLYIPSKYTIKYKSNISAPVYKLKYIDMEGKESVAEEYAGDPEDIEQNYANQVQLSPDNKIEEHLENNYNHSISLDDISKDDKDILRALYRQMKRLRYSVQNIKYKLAVIYQNYICAIRRDDSIDCIFIKNFPGENTRRLVVIADLETFYEKNEKVIHDISKVKNSIYFILEKNQSMHTSMIDKIMHNQKDILSIPSLAAAKKAGYDDLIYRLEKLLADVMGVEEQIIDKIRGLNIDGNDVQSDIAKVHQKTQYEKELDKMSSIKAEITKNMFILKDKRETSILQLDKIMFDNTVMSDAIIQNFSKMRELC